MKIRRLLPPILSAAMVMSMMSAPAQVLAQDGNVSYQDGTYTGYATVYPDMYEDFDAYDISVNVTVAGGTVSGVSYGTGATGDNVSYANRALNGRGSYAGVAAQVIAANSADQIDAVSSATCSSVALQQAVQQALAQAVVTTPVEDETPVDKSALQTLVDEVSALKEDEYTADSWSTLQSALTAAQAVLDNAEATQEETDSAKTALSEAKEALKEVEEETDALSEETKEALEAAIASADEYTQNLYTSESWDALKEAVDQASALSEAEDATEEAAQDAIEAIEDAIEGLAGRDGYILMNIPYSEFYAAELNNSVSVDAVSSATLNKTRTSNLVGGSYHTDPTGTEIRGIVYPVHVADLSELEGKEQVGEEDSVTIQVTNRGQTSTTDYTGSAALFQNSDYAFYVCEEDAAPATYKELTVNADGSYGFSAAAGAVKSMQTTATITTNTTYGDYQINLEDIGDVGTVYAVKLTTTDGTSYGLRHLENIWLDSQLAFSTGGVTTTHGCTLSYAHYESIVGKTISGITYYTENGIYNLETNLYAAIKTDAGVAVENGQAGSGSVALTLTDLPQDYQAAAEIEGVSSSYADGKLNYTDAVPGSYTVTVTDQSGKYAPLKATVLLSTEDMPAAYNKTTEAPALVAADDFTEDDLASYIKKISSVKVGEKSYSASGRGSVRIVNADGTINMEAVSGENPIFSGAETYEVTISSTGYPDLTFTIGAQEEPGDQDDDNKDNTGDQGDDNKDNTGDQGDDNGNTGNQDGDSKDPAANEDKKPSDQSTDNKQNNANQTTESVTYADQTTGVLVTVPAGAFSEEVKLVIEELTSGDVYESLKANTDFSGIAFKLYEIHFENAAGKEVEPAKSVQISMPIPDSYAEGVKLYHIVNGKPVEMASTVANSMITISVDSLSPFMLADSGSANKNATAVSEQNDNTTGSTSASASKAASASASKSTSAANSAKTGDAMHLFAYASVLVAALGAAVLAFFRRRRS